MDAHFLATPPPLTPTPTPTAVLFDLDGTLIDSIELIVNSARTALDRHRCPWPGDDVWRAGIGTPLRTQLGQHATDAVSTDDLIDAYREYQYANHDRLVRAYPGVPELIVALRRAGHPLGVVTSKMDELARHGLRHVGLLDHFEAVVGCDSCTQHKPHPEPVLLTLQRMGGTPDNAIFVGDSVFDVQSGNAAGVTTVGVLWGPFTRDQLAPVSPTHLIERPSELLALLG